MYVCVAVDRYVNIRTHENFMTLKQDIATHFLLLTLLSTQNFGLTQCLCVRKAGTITLSSIPDPLGFLTYIVILHINSILFL